MSGEKDRIRVEYKRLRAEIPENVRQEKSAKIMRFLAESSLFRTHECVMSFFPLADEVDISRIRVLCHSANKRLAFPKVCGDVLDFYEVKKDDPLSEGSFHVMEPVVSVDRKPVFWENALCLTPGVVFDRFGNRFGYGRGFYDRYFAAHPRLIRCGIAFSEQICQNPLPVEQTDLPVQFLLTDDGFLLQAAG